MAHDSRPITGWLRLLARGDREGLDQLVGLLYTTLRRMCRARLGRSPVNLLTPTALLHELYIDLEGRYPDLANRKQFFAYAHRAIEHLAVSFGRKDGAQKRGAGMPHVGLEGVDLADERLGPEIVETFEVLARIEAQDPMLAEIIKLRVFDGRSERDTAEVLGITRKKLQTQWRMGQRLLAHLLGVKRETRDGPL